MFKQKKNKELIYIKDIEYLSGSCLKTEKAFYYLKNKERYRIDTQRILDSWNFPVVVSSTEPLLEKYPVVGKLAFREGSLIQNITDGKRYIISNNKKRLVADPLWLEIYGITEKDFTVASDNEVNLHDDGEILDD